MWGLGRRRRVNPIELFCFLSLRERVCVIQPQALTRRGHTATPHAHASCIEENTFGLTASHVPYRHDGCFRHGFQLPRGRSRLLRGSQVQGYPWPQSGHVHAQGCLQCRDRSRREDPRRPKGGDRGHLRRRWPGVHQGARCPTSTVLTAFVLSHFSRRVFGRTKRY